MEILQRNSNIGVLDSMMRLHYIASLIMVTAGCTPRATPEGISKGPYLQNPTKGGITVCWVTDKPAKGSVLYRLGELARKNGQFETIRQKQPVQYHKVHLKNLQPYHLYQYEVEC